MLHCSVSPPTANALSTFGESLIGDSAKTMGASLKGDSAYTGKDSPTKQRELTRLKKAVWLVLNEKNILNAKNAKWELFSIGEVGIPCRFKRHSLVLWRLIGAVMATQSVRTIFWKVETGDSIPWNQSESGLSEDIWKSLCRWFDSASGARMLRIERHLNWKPRQTSCDWTVICRF